MLIVRERVEPAPHDAELVLPLELRQKTRLRTRLADGQEVGLFLERGAVLRDGDCLRAEDGRVVRVVAAAEDLLEARCDDAAALARVAYHLGNRHAAVEIGAGGVRFAVDEVLAAMVRGLGADVRAVRAPFEPERGAYGSGHHTHAPEVAHRGIIHDFVGHPSAGR